MKTDNLQVADFPKEHAEVLFGKDFTVQKAFELLDRDNNGQVVMRDKLRYHSLSHQLMFS